MIHVHLSLPDRENQKMSRIRVHYDVWIYINLHIPFIVAYFTEWFRIYEVSVLYDFTLFKLLYKF